MKKFKALHFGYLIAEKDQSVWMVVVKKLFILFTDHLPHLLFVLLVKFAFRMISIPDRPLEDNSMSILHIFNGLSLILLIDYTTKRRQSLVFEVHFYVRQRTMIWNIILNFDWYVLALINVDLFRHLSKV